METINVVNIKCSGCASHIRKELEKIGTKDVQINLEEQKISYNGNKAKVEERLSQLGYPKAGTLQAKSILKKAISFKSCAIGKMQR